jgi:hypothetical protein
MITKVEIDKQEPVACQERFAGRARHDLVGYFPDHPTGAPATFFQFRLDRGFFAVYAASPLE